MKVKDLIIALVEFDMDADVWMDPTDDCRSQRAVDCGYREVLDVEYGQGGNPFLKVGSKRKYSHKEAK